MFMFDKKNLTIHIIKHVLKAVLAIGICVAVVIFLGGNIARISDSILEKRTLTFVAEKRIETLTQLRKDLSAVGDRQQALANSLPPIEDILPFVTALEQTNQGIYPPQQIRFGGPTPKDEVFEIPYSISAEGTLEQVIRHIRAIEALPFFSAIKSITIQSVEGSWKNRSSVSLSGSFYAQ